MCEKIDLIKAHLKHIDSNYSDEEKHDVAVENALHECSILQNFPRIQLVTNLSGQKYEKASCKSNMAFITLEQLENIKLQIKYKYPIEFNKVNLRTIRKLLESVDEKHCLVFVRENANNFAIGVCPTSYTEGKMIPIVRITGHMEWEAEILGETLFQYSDGEIVSAKTKVDKSNLSYALEKAFEKEIAEKLFPKVEKMTQIIADLNHGTTVVILNDRLYEEEKKRLITPQSGHGIELEDSVNFFSENEDELKEYLSQITKIDGGIILNINGDCRHIGCIFDGKVSNSFVGNSGRGSRYNSVKLYIDTKENGAIGIVFSDDGTVNFIPEKSL